MFEPLVRAPSRSPTQPLPGAGAPARGREGVRPLGRRPHRRGHRVRGPDTVAAVFLEPVQNSGGCFPPPRLLRASVRSATKYDVLLVSDEVICSFGRIGADVRLRRLQLRARHHHLRQGHDLRVLPHRRDDRQRPPVRAVLAEHDLLPARLHLRRPPGQRGGGDGQPRHLRARGPEPARQGQRPEVPRHPRAALDLPIVGDVRGAEYFYGIEQ